MHDFIQNRIKLIFDETQDPQEALNRVYRLFIPQWDNNTPQYSTPKCGNSLYRYLSSLFHILDYKNNPQKPTGKLWLSQGFVPDSSLGNWEFQFNPCQLPEDSCFS